MVLVEGVVGLQTPVFSGTSGGRGWNCTLQSVVVLVKGGNGGVAYSSL